MSSPERVSAIAPLFDDAFTDPGAGAGPAGLGERWTYVQAPDFVADDGVATASPDGGVSITPPARNARTGEPMFSKHAEGFAGHLKWMVVSTQTFSTAGRPLRVSFRARARCFGTRAHPYGAAVSDPDTDLRLGAATLNVLDLGTGVVFDFWLTSTTIVPFYERIRPPGVPQYEAFGSVGAAVQRRVDDVHDLAIVIDGDAGTARWEVDGATVAGVDNVGSSAPNWSTVLHHGGTPESVGAGTFQVGMGLMTLLDASLPGGHTGLVDIGGHLEHPSRFAATGPDLFGQGVALDVQHVRVEAA